MISGIGTHEIPSSHLMSGLVRSQYTNNFVVQPFVMGATYPQGWVPSEAVGYAPELNCISYSVASGALRITASATETPTHENHVILFPLPSPIATGEHFRMSVNLREDSFYFGDLWLGLVNAVDETPVLGGWYQWPITGGEWAWGGWAGSTLLSGDRLQVAGGRYFGLSMYYDSLSPYEKVIEIRNINIERLRG